MDRKTHFAAGIKDYIVGMAIEIVAICVMMLTALVIGILLVSWYSC